MKVDYIVVGLGLAGIAFCEQLRQAKKRFVVFNNASQQASLVAAGMYNPVILKRFTEVWMAQKQLDIALPMYQGLEALLGLQLDYKMNVYRRLASVEEQNAWFTAMDKPNLEPFMAPKLVKNTNDLINAPFHLGAVQHAGRVDTAALISGYKAYLLKNKQLLSASFNHAELKQRGTEVSYTDIRAQHVVFCEGFGMAQNPFFNYLPLQGNKGEVLTVRVPNLHLKDAIKAGVFIMPNSDTDYYVGATYNRFDVTNTPTQKGKDELLRKLQVFLKRSPSILKHEAGIRPTVPDRRPLVGSHPEFKQLHVLNGMGSRGVMIAPYAAQALYNYIENKCPLNPEIAISRF
ncbi:NAD(P)/FAD-dependent oxidoreductase [Bizionia sediminis]|uniref:NAD(P)/FAD-dependent oxidoreductase n=1 Tax=Bizionia sediminis TaxID=1737064 RepID=A0ABW5KWI3_9FLAO